MSELIDQTMYWVLPYFLTESTTSELTEDEEEEEEEDGELMHLGNNLRELRLSVTQSTGAYLRVIAFYPEKG